MYKDVTHCTLVQENLNKKKAYKYIQINKYNAEGIDELINQLLEERKYI